MLEQVKATTEPKDMPFEAVVIRPKGTAAVPGVLFPHGGPHSAYPAAYSNLVAFQAAQGYAVIAVNFRCHRQGLSTCCSTLHGCAVPFPHKACSAASQCRLEIHCSLFFQGALPSACWYVEFRRVC